MKIKHCDVADIVRELWILGCYNSAKDKKATEIRILDYAIENAESNCTTVLEELHKLREFYDSTLRDEEIPVSLILETINRSVIRNEDRRKWYINPKELEKIYLEIRCIGGVLYSNVRGWDIEEMGFSEELCKILEQYCKQDLYCSALASNLIRNITREQLVSITNNNQILIDEFDKKVKALGFKWDKQLDGVEKIDIYDYIRQEYLEIDVRNLIKQEDKNNNIKTKIQSTNLQYNPIMEQPFKSEAFRAMPKEFQDWMKIGFMQDILQQTKSTQTFKTNQSGRIISQMVENQEKSNNKFVEVKSQKARKKSIKKQDMLKLIQNDLNVIYDLADDFIISNQDDIWECIILGDGNAKQKRELLRHIDNVCNQKQV